jgi:hypothetical protein
MNAAWRRKTLRHFSLAAAGTLFGVVLVEGSVRCFPVPLFQDFLREFYVSNFIEPEFHKRCPAHASRCVAPNGRFAVRVPGLRLRYSTGPAPVEGCWHGYRLNGRMNERPAHGLVLGDSMTENIRVDDAETWVSRLSDRANKRFLNLGASGTGTLYSLDMARLYISRSKPRIVLLQLNDNDAEDDYRFHAGFPGMEIDVEKRPRDPELAHWERSPGFFRRSVLLFALNRWGRPAHWWDRAWRDGSEPVSVEPPDAAVNPALRADGPAALQRRTIDAIRRETQNNGARLGLILFDETPGGTYAAFLNLDEWSRRHDVPVFRARSGKGFLFDGHPNVESNDRFADEIHRWLTTLGYLADREAPGSRHERENAAGAPLSFKQP